MEALIILRSGLLADWVGGVNLDIGLMEVLRDAMRNEIFSLHQLLGGGEVGNVTSRSLHLGPGCPRHYQGRLEYES